MPKLETREQEESDLAAYTALAKNKSISAATLNASSKLKRRKAKKVG